MEKTKVVIADDCDRMRMFIADVVSAEEGIAVVGQAKNGLEACELVRTKQPDILLLDLVMPKMDGICVLERLMSDQHLKKCPRVIVISAVDSERMVQEVFDKGASYYFTKPFEPATLLKRIHALAECGSERHVLARRIASWESADMMLKRDAVQEISEIFHKLGIPAHLNGYRYLRDAIVLSLFNANHRLPLTKKLYPQIATKYGITAAQVERSMRHAIETGWCRGNVELIHTLFSYTVPNERGKPTNSEFIALIADKLRVEML